MAKFIAGTALPAKSNKKKKIKRNHHHFSSCAYRVGVEKTIQVHLNTMRGIKVLQKPLTLSNPFSNAVFHMVGKDNLNVTLRCLDRPCYARLPMTLFHKVKTGCGDSLN